MDCNSPASYVEGTATGLQEAEEFIQYTLAQGRSLILPCIAPRFIPTCTPGMMKGEYWAHTVRHFFVYVLGHPS